MKALEALKLSLSVDRDDGPGIASLPLDTVDIDAIVERAKGAS